MRILVFEDLNYEFNTHTYTWNNLSTMDFELDTQTPRVFRMNLSCSRCKGKYVKHFLVNEFKFNTNTDTSKNDWEFKCIYFHAHGNYASEGGVAVWKMPVLKLEHRQTTMDHQIRGEAFLLTVGAFLLTVKLLCLQSLQALIRRTLSL